jgi:mRNA interferase RelE/StbE
MGATVKYRLEVRPAVLKALAKIPGKDQQRIRAAIRALADDPRPVGCLPVKDAKKGSYRIRVGRYRVVYIVLEELVLVTVTRVAKRDESTYRDLD